MPLQTTLRALAWRRVLPASAAALLIKYAVVTLVITVYATALGIRMRGAPDPVQVRAFADGLLPWAAPLALGLFTLAAALWVSRHVRHAAALHGFAVGTVVAALSLVLGVYSQTAVRALLAASAVALMAGWLGGILGRRMQKHSRSNQA